MSDRPKDQGPKQRLTKTRRAVVIKADGSYALTSDEEDTLATVLDEAATAFADMSARLQSFGRFVLREVFQGDAGAARSSGRGTNPVWLELKRRAGGPTLRLSDNFLSVAVRIASWDKTIGAEDWRNLDVARKEILLPLAKADQLAKAAKHVTDFKLDDEATTTYVASLRKEQGKPKKTRLTPERALKHTHTFVKTLRAGGAAARLGAAVGEMTARERNAVEKELEDLATLARELLEAVRRR